MKKLICLFLTTILLQPKMSAAEKTESCPAKFPKEKMTRLYKGMYANPAEGFDVLIPQGMLGRDFDDPSYQRGFVILFPDREESLIVDGEHNSLYWKDAREAATFDSSAYRDDGRKTHSSEGRVIALDGRQAYSITATYSCPGSGIQYSSITAAALSANGEYEYMLRWEGRPNELENGRKIMQSLYSTWHFRKPTG